MAILRVVYQRLKRLGQAGDLDEVGHGGCVGGLEEVAQQDYGNDGHQDGGEQRRPGLRNGPDLLFHNGDGRLERLGPMLDFGADGETNVFGSH